MQDLIVWLKGRTGNVAVFESFSIRARALAAAQPEHAALLGLLCWHSERFLALHYNSPMTGDVSTTAHQAMLGYLTRGLEDVDAPADHQLNLLNEIALGSLDAEPGSNAR